MQVLVPMQQNENDVVFLNDGTHTKTLEDMLRINEVVGFFFAFEEMYIFPTWDETKEWDIGSVAIDAIDQNTYYEVIGKNSAGNILQTHTGEAYSLFLQKQASAYSVNRFLKKEDFYFNEVDNGDGTYTYNIYMSLADGINAIADMQLITSYLMQSKLDSSNLVLSANSYPKYTDATTIKRGYILSVDVTSVHVDGNSTTTMTKPLALFKALVDTPTSTPLEGNVLEWEQLPFYGHYALYDKYINTRFETSSYVGWNFLYTDSDIEAAAVLYPTGTTANFTWKNETTEVTESIPVNTRTVNTLSQFFLKKLTPKTLLLSEKALLNIDSVRVEMSGDKVGAATVIVGKIYDIGKNDPKHEKSSRDFRQVTTTASGYDYIVAGFKTASFKVKALIENERYEEIFELLQSLSTTLSVYIAADGNWVYGWYKALRLTKTYDEISEYTLEINGVI